MADNSAPLRKDWKFHECASALRECLKTARIRKKGLKKAVVENDIEEVRGCLEGGGRHGAGVNKRWVFSTPGCTLQVPPLCVAVCLHNLDILHWLLEHGANPNRLSFVCLEESGSGMKKTDSISPLMFALRDCTSDSLQFDDAVASALVQGGADINSEDWSNYGEEEEEGGTLRYSHSRTVLFHLATHVQPSTLPAFKFLLNNGATMFLRDDGSDKHTVLQSLLDVWSTNPEDNVVLTFAKELIRFGGFHSCPSLSLNASSELLLLVDAWELSVMEGRNEHEILPPRIIHFLLDAGYVCSKDEVARFQTSALVSHDQCMVDKVCGLHVYSLKQLCRQRIRNSVTHGCQLQKLNCLPQCLIQYLMFADT